MSTTQDQVHAEAAAAPRPDGTPGARGSAVLLIAGVLSIVVGFGSLFSGLLGIGYTWNQADIQNIVTPDDASIPGVAVRGPFTMLSQRDIIVEHTLEGTHGLYYAELPRQVPLIGEDGVPVLDAAGEAVLVPNQERNIWLAATTLTNALNLGILAYGMAALAIVTGLALVGSGAGFLILRKSAMAG